MKRLHGLACATLLCIATGAAAQLKPSGPDTLPLPATPAELRAKEAQAGKERAARDAAEQWLRLLDAGDYGKAWDQCAKAFRERVSREQWTASLPKTRGELGAVKSRRVEVASFRPTMPGMPAGDYVTVRFVTSFEKRSEAQEHVALVLEDGAWRPLGYGI